MIALSNFAISCRLLTSSVFLAMRTKTRGCGIGEFMNAKKFLKKILLLPALAIFIICTSRTSVSAAELPTEDTTLSATEVVKSPTHIPTLSLSDNISRSVIGMAAYRAWDFTTRSSPEPVDLQEDCNAIAFIATCANDATDTLVFHAIDHTHGGLYSLSISFEANGKTQREYWSLPAGKYTFYVTGSANIMKNEVLVVPCQIN